ncbi:hypothetical protein H6771_01350 [Candidatus Peribacteria bacterium]|nr:hypothetical protein [Candidatus Peribacteria bacterium]
MQRLSLLVALGLAVSGCSYSALPLMPSTSDEVLTALHSQLVDSIMTDLEHQVAMMPDNYYRTTDLKASLMPGAFDDKADIERLALTMGLQQTAFTQNDQQYAYNGEPSGTLNLALQLEADYSEEAMPSREMDTHRVFKTNADLLQKGDDRYFRVSELESTFPELEITRWTSDRKNSYQSVVAQWFTLNESDMAALGMPTEMTPLVGQMLTALLALDSKAQQETFLTQMRTALESMTLLQSAGDLTRDGRSIIVPVQMTDVQMMQNIRVMVQAYAHFVQAQVPGLMTSGMSGPMGMVEAMLQSMDDQIATTEPTVVFSGELRINQSDMRQMTLSGVLLSGITGEVEGTLMVEIAPELFRATVVMNGDTMLFQYNADRILVQKNKDTVLEGTWADNRIDARLYGEVYNPKIQDTERFPLMVIDLIRSDAYEVYEGSIRLASNFSYDPDMYVLDIHRLQMGMNNEDVIVDFTLGVEDTYGVRRFIKDALTVTMTQKTEPRYRSTITPPVGAQPLSAFLEVVSPLFGWGMPAPEGMTAPTTMPTMPVIDDTRYPIGGSRVRGIQRSFRGVRYRQTYTSQEEQAYYTLRQRMGIMADDRREGSMMSAEPMTATSLGYPVVIPEMYVEDYENLVPVQQ